MGLRTLCLPGKRAGLVIIDDVNSDGKTAAFGKNRLSNLGLERALIIAASV